MLQSRFKIILRYKASNLSHASYSRLRHLLVLRLLNIVYSYGANLSAKSEADMPSGHMSSAGAKLYT